VSAVLEKPVSAERLIAAIRSSCTAQDRATILALGREAAAFMKRLLDGQPVDVEQGVEKLDRYGRLLAYLWLADGSMANVTIVREGYAQPFTKSPNVRYAALLRQSAGQASREGSL
jgi:micrococcal nuclease